MTLRRAQIIVLAALALLIPLRASAGDGSGSLAVSASLGGCGLAGSGVVCEINTSFNAIDGAEYYTATVTLADASVRSFGTVGPGGASFYVPYVGAGVYRVEITAWGFDTEGKPEEIESDEVETDGKQLPGASGEQAPAEKPADPLTDGDNGDEQAAPEGTSEEPASEPAPPAEPVCDPATQPESLDSDCPAPAAAPAPQPAQATAAEPEPLP